MTTRQGNMRVWFSQFLICLTVLMMATVVYAQGTIKIGVLGPMKFDVGAEYWSAATLAQEEINAAGGVRIGNQKFKLELIKADSNEMLSITDAVSAMEKLVTIDKVNFVVGGHRSEAVLAMQDIVADNKVIWINAYTGHPSVTQRVAKQYDRYKYYFRLASLNSTNLSKIYFNEASMVADKLKKQLGIPKVRVAIMAEKVLWVDPIAEGAKTKLAEMGMEVVGTWRHSPNAVDVTSELTAIKNSGAHMIFYVGSGPVGTIVCKQWSELQIPAALMGSNVSAMTDRIVKTIGRSADYVATYNYFGYAQLTPRTIPFMEKMKKRYGTTPTIGGTLYDCVYVLKDAIERAGTLNTDAMIASIENTDYVGASGRIAFTKKGDPNWVHDIIFAPRYTTNLVTQWRNGKLLAVWPDGKPMLGDNSWKGIRYKGTVEYEVPPWVITYWKGKR